MLAPPAMVWLIGAEPCLNGLSAAALYCFGAAGCGWVVSAGAGALVAGLAGGEIERITGGGAAAASGAAPGAGAGRRIIVGAPVAGGGCVCCRSTPPGWLLVWATAPIGAIRISARVPSNRMAGFIGVVLPRLSFAHSRSRADHISPGRVRFDADRPRTCGARTPDGADVTLSAAACPTANRSRDRRAGRPSRRQTKPAYIAEMAR